MSVYKPARSPYFHYDFVWKGDRFYGSTGCRTKREAERHEERERVKARDGVKTRPSITVDDAAGLYEESQTGNRSWATTRYILAALVEGLGANKLMADVSQLDLSQLVARRRAGRANSSVNREIEVWRALWRQVDDARFNIGEMPKWKSLFLKVANIVPRELKEHEEDSLLPELRADIYDFCLFALRSGWRLSEVIGLRWVDVDMRTATAVTRIKGGDYVSRPLSMDMVITIANQPKIGPFVFTYVAVRNRPGFKDKLGRTQPARKAGERYPMTKTVLRKPWHAAMSAAKVENFRFHDLRHTRGTRIVRSTGNLAAAKRALEHKDMKTTLRYAHVLDDDVRKALEDSDSRTIPEQETHGTSKASENKG